MFKASSLETKDGQKLALCTDCGFHILVNVIKHENAPLEWDPSPAERRHWTNHPEIKWKGGNGGPHLCGPNQIEDVTVLTMRSDTVESDDETLTSVNRWSSEVFGEPSPVHIHAGRVLEEVCEACVCAGMEKQEAVDLVKKTFDKIWGKLSLMYPTHHFSEIKEIIKEEYGEELSDVVITCASRTGIDHQANLNAKMKINRGRTWRKDPDGCWRHVKKGTGLEDQRSSDQRTPQGSNGTT